MIATSSTNNKRFIFIRFNKIFANTHFKYCTNKFNVYDELYLQKFEKPWSAPGIDDQHYMHLFFKQNKNKRTKKQAKLIIITEAILLK